jgi:hypothetical protein
MTFATGACVCPYASRYAPLHVARVPRLGLSPLGALQERWERGMGRVCSYSF